MEKFRAFNVATLLGAYVTLVSMHSIVSASSIHNVSVQTIYLKAFEAVQICVPLGVHLVPSQKNKLGGYSLKIEGQSSLHESLEARVEAGVLYLETKASFEIQADAKLTLSVPSNALKTVTLKAASDLYISPGFQASALQLTAASLGGTISAAQVYVQRLSIQANGLASVVASGEIDYAKITADGGATVRVSGLKHEADVQLTGIPVVAIQAQSSGASIKGSTQGSKVTYNTGSCLIKDNFSGSGVGTCLRDKNLEIVPEPKQWTCKATSTGPHQCSASGTSSSSFSSVGTGCKTMTDTDPNTVTRSARRLRDTSSSTSTSSTSTSTSGSGSTGASTYTYTSNTPSDDGTTSQTVCNFVNNVGSCQVNGTPVPVRQYGLGGTPVPAPSAGGDAILQAAAAAAISSNSQSSASGYASPGGTVCTFVNGIGGCSTGK